VAEFEKGWCRHKDVHSYGLSVTVGPVTRLVQIMRSRSVQRDVSIMLEYLMTVHRMGRHMVETIVLHMLQEGLQYIDWMISWTEDETIDMMILVARWLLR